MHAKSRAVSTLGDKKLDSYAGTLLSASVKQHHFWSSTMGLAFVAADIPVFAFVASRLARLMAKPTVGACNRLKRCVRYMRGHFLDVSKYFRFKMKCADLASAQKVTEHTIPRPQERIMRSDHDGRTLFARTSFNTDGTGTLIRRSGIRCSSQRTLQLGLALFSGSRHGTDTFNATPRRLNREQRHCMPKDLSLGTENVNMTGNDQNDDETDAVIHQVEQRRAERRQVDSFDHSLEVKDQLMKPWLMCHVQRPL